MRRRSHLALALLGLVHPGCGDMNFPGFSSGFGPPNITRLPSGVARFAPASIVLRLGETRDMTLLLDPSLRSVHVRWWGSQDPVVKIADFACEPEKSCGLVRFSPEEAATLQLLDCRVLRMRVTATAVGQGSVVASVNTCVPSRVFCDDEGSGSLFVQVRP